MTLVNLGPSVAQNVTITDVMSAGLTLSGTPVVTGGSLLNSNASGATATAATLAAGQTLTMVVNATVTATTGNVTNTAAGTSTTPDPSPPGTVTVPTPVAASADLVLSKVASAANGTAGGTISYTVTLVNLGPSTAQNVTITDVMSAGLTLSGTPVVTGGSLLNSNASGATATAATLAAGQTLTMVVNATVTATTGNVTNTAAGTSTTPDPSPPGTVTVPTPVAASADLVLSKVASAANGTAGGTISYTVTLVNLGPSTAQNVTITDVMSAGLTLSGTPVVTGGSLLNSNASGATATAATLAAGQTLTMVVNATVTATTGNVTNTAAGTSTTPDPSPPGTVTVPTPVAASADLVLSKVASAANGTAGGTISYTVTLVNLGPSTAQNVTITDVMSAGLTLSGTPVVTGGSLLNSNASGATATAATLAAGQTLTMVVNATVTATTGNVTNTAAGTSTTPDPSPPGTVTVPTPVAASADLVLSKVASAANGTAGGTISYTVTLVNLGPSTAQNVTITDVMSAGLTLSGTPVVTGGSLLNSNASGATATAATLAAGQTLTMVVNATVTATTGNVTNTAAGTSTTPDPSPPGTVTVPTPVAASADLVLSKVASAANGTAGGTISYTVTLVNLGPSVAQNVTITDAMSAGLTLSGTPVVTGGSLLNSNASGATATAATLAAGQTPTMVVNATVTATTGNVTNTAAGTSTTPDPSPPGTVTVPTPVAASADLATTISVTPNGTPGAVINATVTFSNNGPSTAQNVTGTIVLPNGTTQTVVIGSLNAGANTVTLVSYTVPAGSTTVQSWTAGVATTTPESTTANNTVTAVTAINPLTDVQTTISVTPNGTPGAVINATVTFSNNGPSTAQNVTGTIVLPNGTTETVVIGSLNAGANTVTLVSYTVPAGSTTVQSWTAGVATTTPESTTANNTVTAVTAINPLTDVQTTISVTPNGTPGAVINATVTFSNNGPSTAQNVTGTIVLPNGTTQTVVIGSLNAGANTVTTVRYSVPNGSITVQVWTAGVATTTPESTTANNTVTTASAIALSADIATTISVTSNGTPGAVIGATVTFSNNGPSTAVDVTGTIILPNGTTQTVVIGSLAAGANTVTVVSYTVPDGSTTVQMWKAGDSTLTPEVTFANNTVTAVTRLVRVADMGISKTALSDTAVAGGTLTFTLLITNNGPGTSTGASFVDTLPLGMGTITKVVTQASTGASTASFAVSSGSLNGSVTIPVGGSVTVTFQVQVAGNISGILVNTATVSIAPDMADTVSSNNTATATVRISQPADVSTTLSVTPNGTPGAVINATVTFSNNGPSTAQNVTGTIVLPNGTTQTVVIGGLNAGANTVTLVSYTVPAGSTTVQSWTAGVATTTPESTTANNTVTAVTTINALVDVSTTLNVPATAVPGTTIQVTVTFANLGPSVAQFVTGTLVLPNGSSTAVFSVSAMPPGSSTVVVVPYPVPSAQSIDMRWTATIATISPEVNLGNNIATGVTGVGTVTNASVSGFVWYDLNRNRIFDAAPVDQPMAGFRVELLKGTEVVGSATTAISGSYLIAGQVPGAGYSLRFLDPTGKQVYGTPFNQSAMTLNSNPSTGTNSLTSAVSPDQQVPVAGVINNVTLYAGDNVIQQNLPVDPSGVVYDSVTRQPVAGASVTLNGPAGFDPSVHLVGKSDVSTTGVNGFYQFLLTGNAPSGPYTLSVTPPAGYAATPATQGGVTSPGVLNPVPPGVTLVQPQSTPPAIGLNGAATVYYLGLTFNKPSSGEVFNNHIPLDPVGSGAILITKVGNKTIAEMGDSVQYTIRLRNTSNSNITNVVLQDVLPQGFRYIASTVRLIAGAGTTTIAEPTAGSARHLNFNIGTIAGNGSVELSYYLRVGVGAQQGDGINRATAVFPGPGGTPVSSNTAQFKVNVQGGVFTSRGCVIGKVYVDCDGNAMQNADGGPNEVAHSRRASGDAGWQLRDHRR